VDQTELAEEGLLVLVKSGNRRDELVEPAFHG